MTVRIPIEEVIDKYKVALNRLILDETVEGLTHAQENSMDQLVKIASLESTVLNIEHRLDKCVRCEDCSGKIECSLKGELNHLPNS